MSLQTNFSSPCLEAGLTKQILKQTNVTCIPKHKREFCRDHHLTFLCSSLLQTDLCLNGKVKFGGKKFQIIILGLSHKVCCLLPSPSYCNMVYALRLTRFRLSLSLYFNERSAVKGRARHACHPSTGDWGRVRLYGRGGPFLQVLFSFVLFLLVVFLVFFHFKIKGNKQTNKKWQGAESHLAHSYVARYLQLSRPNADLC